MKDYYQILGIDKKATKDDIKKAFRKLASQYHPDKKTGDETKFKEVSEAYSVLGDEKKRAEYDTYGRAFNGAGAQGGGFGGFNWSQQGFNGMEFDLNDIFENFGDVFGNGFGGRRSRRGNDISIDIEIPFKESIFGTARRVVISKQNACESCEGTGAKSGTSMSTCQVCNGQGKIREARQSILGSFATVRECSECHGKGEVPKEKCADCKGAGVKKSRVEIDIKIPAGIQNGEVIRLAGQGEALKGAQSGDLYVKIHVQADRNIKREGSNLIKTQTIKLTDALLGASYDIETLDGNVKVNIPVGVRHNEILKIKDKGVPVGNRRGDFLIKIDIELPSKLSKKAKKLVEELKEEGV